MAAALFMDYMYFENKNQGQDNNNWERFDEVKIENAILFGSTNKNRDFGLSIYFPSLPLYYPEFLPLMSE